MSKLTELELLIPDVEKRNTLLHTLNSLKDGNGLCSAYRSMIELLNSYISVKYEEKCDISTPDNVRMNVMHVCNLLECLES
jgi:hypothetical protein